MARLEIALLGGFQVRLCGKPVTAFESDKVRALLAYLALEAERPQRRERLAGLLWPERSESSARQNLSQALDWWEMAEGLLEELKNLCWTQSVYCHFDGPDVSSL